MTRRGAAALLALVVLLLSACSPEGYYLSARTHFSQRSENPLPSSNERNSISDMEALRTAIQNTIDARREEEDLIIRSYDGDWSADFQDIRKEMQEQYPYGSYSISYLGYTQKTVFTQTLLTLNITYRDSAFERSEIVEVPDSSDFERRITELMGNFAARHPSDSSSSAAYLFSSFTDSDEAFEARLMKCWVSNAVNAVGLHGISFAFYPESGKNRIAEITVQFLQPFEELGTMTREIQKKATDIAAGFTGGGDSDKLYYTYKWLWDNVEYLREDVNVVAAMDGKQPKENKFTAYGALVEGSAEQSGYALAAQVILKALDMDSRVIVGAFDGQPYYWVYVNADGEWLHFDPSANRLAEQETDEEEPDPEAPPTEEGEEEPQEEEELITHKYLFGRIEASQRFTWDKSVYITY